jgi:hypothetical protein
VADETMKCSCCCENEGPPNPGFDFYLCADCAGEMEFWLNFYAMQDERSKAKQ